MKKLLNDAFRKKGQELHDALPPEARKAHEPALKRYLDLDHMGEIQKRLKNKDDAIDVATDMLYGIGERGTGLFARYDHRKGHMAESFLASAQRGADRRNPRTNKGAREPDWEEKVVGAKPAAVSLEDKMVAMVKKRGAGGLALSALLSGNDHLGPNDSRREALRRLLVEGGLVREDRFNPVTRKPSAILYHPSVYTPDPRSRQALAVKLREALDAGQLITHAAHTVMGGKVRDAYRVLALAKAMEEDPTATGASAKHLRDTIRESLEARTNVDRRAPTPEGLKGRGPKGQARNSWRERGAKDAAFYQEYIHRAVRRAGAAGLTHGKLGRVLPDAKRRQAALAALVAQGKIRRGSYVNTTGREVTTWHPVVKLSRLDPKDKDADALVRPYTRGKGAKSIVGFRMLADYLHEKFPDHPATKWMTHVLTHPELKVYHNRFGVRRGKLNVRHMMSVRYVDKEHRFEPIHDLKLHFGTHLWSFQAPAGSKQEIREYLEEDPWNTGIMEHADHLPDVKLSRMKAPSGGAVVNNQYQSGGRFLAAPLARVRVVAALLKRLRVKNRG